jgi:hypothetical protein
MLISSTFQLSPHVFQASLGDSMRWIVVGERAVAYIDGSPAALLSLFEERLSKLGVTDGVRSYRLFTADCAERLYFPEAITRESTAILPGRGRKHSPPGRIELCAEGASLDLGGVTIHRKSWGLATPASTLFSIEPDGVVVGDLSLGLYRGRELPAPGAPFDLRGSIPQLRELAEQKISCIGLPWSGALTGALTAHHLKGVADVTAELIAEFELSHGNAAVVPEGRAASETVDQGVEADRAQLTAQIAAQLIDSLYFSPLEADSGLAPAKVASERSEGGGGRSRTSNRLSEVFTETASKVAAALVQTRHQLNATPTRE